MNSSLPSKNPGSKLDSVFTVEQLSRFLDFSKLGPNFLTNNLETIGDIGSISLKIPMIQGTLPIDINKIIGWLEHNGRIFDLDYSQKTQLLRLACSKNIS